MQYGKNDLFKDLVLEEKGFIAKSKLISNDNSQVSRSPDMNRDSVVVNILLFYKKILTYFANAF